MRQKPLVADALQFGVSDDPFLGSPTSAGPLLSVNAAQAAPLAHGELGLAEDLCCLFGGVPVLEGALLEKLVRAWPRSRDAVLVCAVEFRLEADRPFGLAVTGRCLLICERTHGALTERPTPGSDLREGKPPGVRQEVQKSQPPRRISGRYKSRGSGRWVGSPRLGNKLSSFIPIPPAEQGQGAIQSWASSERGRWRLLLGWILASSNRVGTYSRASNCEDRWTVAGCDIACSSIDKVLLNNLSRSRPPRGVAIELILCNTEVLIRG